MVKIYYKQDKKLREIINSKQIKTNWRYFDIIALLYKGKIISRSISKICNIIMW